MNIVIKRYLKTASITSATSKTRMPDAENSDIVMIVKKAEGKIGLAVSSDFLDSNLNPYNDIDVSRSSVAYGPYGNVLDIPETTYALLFPLATNGITVRKFNKAMEDVFSKLGEVSKEGNDFIVFGKKLMGAWAGANEHQLVAIGTLESFGKDIDLIYSDSFRKNSGKKLPSERVIGYNDLAEEKVDMRGFAEIIQEAFNRLTDVYIESVIEVDGDVEC